MVLPGVALLFRRFLSLEWQAFSSRGVDMDFSVTSASIEDDTQLPSLLGYPSNG